MVMEWKELQLGAGSKYRTQELKSGTYYSKTEGNANPKYT